MNRFLRQKPKLNLVQDRPVFISAQPTPIVNLDPNSQLAKAFQAAHTKLNPETPDAA